MTTENTDTPLKADCPSATCSRSLRARLREVIQKFRDEAESLLLDKSSRALGGAIAYGDMATALSKLIEKPDKVEDMMWMLSRIGYPQRGTSDEDATIENFAAEIQAKWSLDQLIPGGWEIFDENTQDGSDCQEGLVWQFSQSGYIIVNPAKDIHGLPIIEEFRLTAWEAQERAKSLMSAYSHATYPQGLKVMPCKVLFDVPTPTNDATY